MNEDILPYDSFEIARAKASLLSELSKDCYRFLRPKINSFVRTHSNFPSNLWEGPNGRMEHIRTSFPMPAKETNSENSTVLNEPSNSDTEAQKCDPHLPSKSQREKHTDVKSSQPIDTPRKNESESVDPLCIPSVCDDLDKNQNASNYTMQSPDCANNSSSSSIIDNVPKVIADNSINSNSNHVQKDANYISQTEKQHQMRLSKLLKKIQQAQNDLVSLKACFKKSKEQKACKKMESLHWIIHGFITSLTQEKKCVDKKDFQSSHSPVNQKSQFSNFKVTPLYSKTWSALKRLCSKFKNTWRVHQTILSEFSTLDEIPKSKFQSRLKKIALGKS